MWTSEFFILQSPMMPLRLAGSGLAPATQAASPGRPTKVQAWNPAPRSSGGRNARRASTAPATSASASARRLVPRKASPPLKQVSASPPVVLVVVLVVPLLVAALSGW